MKPKQRPSGGARLIAAGRRPVLLGLLPEEHAQLTAAAAAAQMHLTQFLTYHGLIASKTILRKIQTRA